LEESLALYRELGDKEALAWSLYNLAGTVSDQGEYSRGRSLFEESLAMFRELGTKRGIAACLQQSTLWLFFSGGDQATVRVGLEEILRLYRELGYKKGMAFYFWISGWVALSQGDTATAHTLVEQSLTLVQEMKDRWSAIWAIAFLGRVKAHQGDFSAARTLHEESLTAASALDDPWSTAFCLEGMAGVVSAQGERVWAAHLWGAAESLRERCGILLSPVERVDYEPAVAAARTQLGAKVFEAAWTEGRTMTLAQVLAAPVQTATAPARPSPMYPAGLTVREVEVLRLVARGQTNEQVAEQLVISPRTVNTHLTSIYGKIGVSSRSAATRYAIEHKLV
jgi:ATP/maltotriose-dependent transcriptional regulator MalT